MDALILAAGRGSRLGELTDEVPKSLLDLGGGVSPLDLNLDALAAVGVRRVVLVVGYRREMIVARARQRAGHRLAIEPVWNPFWARTNVLGSVWMARTKLDDAFIYLHADTVFDPAILDEMLATPGDVVLPVDFRPSEPEQMKAEVVDGRIRQLSKELEAHQAAGEFIGLGLFRVASLGAIREAVDAVIALGQLDAYFEAAINWAIAERGLEVLPLPTRGRAWQEIDFAEDLQAARGMLDALLKRSP